MARTEYINSVHPAMKDSGKNSMSPTKFAPAFSNGNAASGLSGILRTFRADAVYKRAEGDYLFQQKGPELVKVLDLIGGFGTNLLGHNHPDVLDELRRLIDAKVPFSAQVSSRPGLEELERLLRAKLGARSEERRVGKECRSGWAA